MPQSVAQILVHAIFSTKDRYPFLTPEVRPELHAYAATVLQGCQSPALVINSVADHVHVLCALSKNMAACDLVEEIKTSTSKWIKTKGGILRKFHWQNGYGVFSVSPSVAPSVKAYIGRQEKHHQRTSFQVEFRKFLDRHGITYEERYVWD
jgi:putative transposase